MDSSSSRKRPFLEFERSFLINLIKEHANIIENKKTDGSTLVQKTTAWASITDKYNASPRISQKVDSKQLKKFWNNFKSKSKTNEYHINITGGGPSVPDMDFEHVQVHSLVPNTAQMPPVKAESDKLEGQEDEDDSFDWTHQKSHEEDIVPPPSPHESTCTTAPDFKKYIFQQDFQNSKKKFKMEYEHLKKIHSLELEEKTLQLQHKKRMFALCEEEMRTKIIILKNKMFN